MGHNMNMGYFKNLLTKYAKIKMLTDHALFRGPEIFLSFLENAHPFCFHCKIIHRFHQCVNVSILCHWLSSGIPFAGDLVLTFFFTASVTCTNSIIPHIYYTWVKSVQCSATFSKQNNPTANSDKHLLHTPIHLSEKCQKSKLCIFNSVHKELNKSC